MKESERIQSTKELEAFEEALRIVKHQALKKEAIEISSALCSGQVVINDDYEGKFQGIALTAYKQASKGKSVHIYTLNESIAKTRMESMEGIMKALNLSTAFLYQAQNHEERQEAYKKDIIWGTPSAFIHDYLKDQKVIHVHERVQGKRSFALVEKGDLILLDQCTRPVGIFGKDERVIDSITLRSYFSNYGVISALVDFDGGEQSEFLDIYGMETIKIMEEEKVLSKENSRCSIYKSLEEKKEAILENINNKVKYIDPILITFGNDEMIKMLTRDLQEAKVPYRTLLKKDSIDLETFVVDAIENKAIMLVVDPISWGIAEFFPENGHIICTERYSLKRLDQHLVRMAQKSESKESLEFILSLEDDLFSAFSEEELKQFKESIDVEKGQSIEVKPVEEMMDYIQLRTKEKIISLRSYVQNFESVIHRQREIIYSEREKVLRKADIKEHVLNLMEKAIDEEIKKFTGNSEFPEEWNLRGLATVLESSFLGENQLIFQDVENLTKRDLKAHLIQQASKAYLEKKKNLGLETFNLMQRVLLLKIIDRKWAEHLESMEELRQDMNLRAMGRQDPIRAFQVEGFELFENMTKTIPRDLIQGLFALEKVEK